VSDGRISAQEAEELAACFTADAPGLFGYACVVTRGDRAQADDLVQAAFEAAGRGWPVLRCLAGEQRRAWLRTTLANTAVSGYRREAAFRDRLPRIESRYRVTPADPRRTRSPRWCWSAAGRSSRRCRSAAHGRDTALAADMKESEIAAALGVAENTVATHLHRARRKLIAQLGPDYPFTAGTKGAPS